MTDSAQSLSVLHVDTAMEWRGGQQQLLYLIDGMVKRGCRVAVATPPDSPLSRRLDPGVERVDIGVGVHPKTALTLRAAMRRGQFDVMACHTAPGHSVAAVVGLPTVVHRRVDFAVGTNPWSRWKYSQGQRFVAVSDGVARVLMAAGVSADVIDVVYDGVPQLESQSPAPDLIQDRPLIGAIGALVGHKAHHLLVSAIQRCPNVDCVIVGEGPLRKALEDQIAELDLANRVRLIGYREDIAAVMAALKLLVHPSIEEGMGQVVVEAMGLGVPVLVSSAGGLPEVVGASSKPFPVGNVEALATEIEARVVSDDDLAGARQRASTLFSIDRMVEGTMASYRKAL